MRHCKILSPKMTEIGEHPCRLVDDYPSETISEQRRDVLEVHGLGTRQVIRLAVMPRLGQTQRSHLRYVPRIDKCHEPSTCWKEYPTVLDKVSQVGGTDVLGEEAWP